MAAPAPIRFLITGAAGQIGYSLIPLVASGYVLGANQPLILHLLDIPPAEAALRGVAMEIEDGAYPLVKQVVATTDVKTAFTGVQVAVLVGGFPRKDGMERKELIAKNIPIFVQQGKALNEFADRNVKVLVVANPANTNCLIAALNAPNIPKKNFTALTRLDMNRGLSQLAAKLHVGVGDVRNLIIWGNHSGTMVVDISKAELTLPDGSRTSAHARVNDEKWVREEFTPTVRKRGAAVIKARGTSSAMSAANAAADHMRSWLGGTRPGEFVSMGIWSGAGSPAYYGVAPELVFSFPVTCRNGEYEVVPGLAISDETRAQLQATEKELKDEKGEAQAL